VPYRIQHYNSRAWYGLQIADYFNWAIYRFWRDGDDRSRALVRRAIKSEFDIFRPGTKLWY